MKPGTEQPSQGETGTPSPPPASNRTTSSYPLRDFKAETERKRAEGKNLGGRPHVEIDYKLLEALCRINATGAECAASLKMHYDTLDRALRRDYEEAMAMLAVDNSGLSREELHTLLPFEFANGFAEYREKNVAISRTSLRREQHKVANNPNHKGQVTMLIWLGKNELGQSDRIDHTTKGGAIRPVRKVERVIVDPGEELPSDLDNYEDQ